MKMLKELHKNWRNYKKKEKSALYSLKENRNEFPNCELIKKKNDEENPIRFWKINDTNKEKEKHTIGVFEGTLKRYSEWTSKA